MRLLLISLLLASPVLAANYTRIEAQYTPSLAWWPTRHRQRGTAAMPQRERRWARADGQSPWGKQ